jgi:hypothetical protein
VKLTEVDPQRLASEVEGWMERRSGWSSNALHVQGRRPPRPALAERDRQKTGVARAVVSLHLFARGDRTVAAQVAEACFRFVWRWVYAPPWTTTSEVEVMGLGELRVEQVTKAPDEALALVMVAARGRLRLSEGAPRPPLRRCRRRCPPLPLPLPLPLRGALLLPLYRHCCRPCPAARARPGPAWRAGLPARGGRAGAPG